jgi:hypothetical protein
MRESLGEVAAQPAARRVVFFGEQPEVVTNRQETLEQLLGVIAAASEQFARLCNTPTTGALTGHERTTAG